MVNRIEKKEQRFLFLKTLYEKTNGSYRKNVSKHEIGKELGYDKETTNNVVDFLEQEGLLIEKTYEGDLFILHSGVLEIEQALDNPTKATEHFPPVVNLIQITAPTNSLNIQQGTSSSTQISTINTEASQDLREIITQLKILQDGLLDLNSNDKEELASDINTLEAQISSPKPKLSILKATLQSIKSAIGKAATQITTDSAIQSVKAATPRVIEMIDNWLNQQPS